MGWGPGDPDSLQAPGSAGPDDSAIIIAGGLDVPLCMQAVYASVQIYQTDAVPGSGIDRQPSLYIGVRHAGITVDIGWLIWDHLTVCGYEVMMAWQGFNNADGLGTMQAAMNFAPGIKSGVPNFARYQLLFGWYDQPGNVPIEMYFNQGLGIGVSNPAKGPIRIDNVSISRGLRGIVTSVANSAAVGAEAVVLTTPNVVFRDGRCYEVRVEAEVLSSVANRWGVNVRQTNLAGAIKLTWSGYNNGPAAPLQSHLTATGKIARAVGAGDLTDVLALTTIASAGTVTHVGAATTVRSLEVWDIGATGDFPNAITI